MTAPFDVEAMIRECVPGGYFCDAQEVADAIRAWCAGVHPAPAGATGDAATVAMQLCQVARQLEGDSGAECRSALDSIARLLAGAGQPGQAAGRWREAILLEVLPHLADASKDNRPEWWVLGAVVALLDPGQGTATRQHVAYGVAEAMIAQCLEACALAIRSTPNVLRGRVSDKHARQLLDAAARRIVDGWGELQRARAAPTSAAGGPVQ